MTTADLPAQLRLVADFFEVSPWARCTDIPTRLQLACGTFTREDPTFGYWDDLQAVRATLATLAGCDVRALQYRLAMAYDLHELPDLIRRAALLLENPTATM